MNSKARKIPWIVIGLLVLALAVQFGFVLRAKQEWGGAAPDARVVGRVSDNLQRSMAQFCTGVVVTPQATWLVGKREAAASEYEFLRDVPDVFGAKPPPADPAAREAESRMRQLLHSREEALSVVSRLNAQGVFEPVTWLPDSACLQPTPDGKRLYLLTGLSRPEPPAGTERQAEPNQLSVFQSDDQGKTWQFVPAGFFPDSGLSAWNVHPYFYDNQSVWAWRDLSHELNEGKLPGTLRPSGLQHSADGGAVVTDVLSPEPLVLTETQALMRMKPGAQWSRGIGEVRRHVLQVDSTHAVAWVSQSFHYATSDNTSVNGNALYLTTRAQLTLREGRWVASDIEVQEGLSLERVLRRPNGQAIAVGTVVNDSAEGILMLSKDNRSWTWRAPLPGAFDPLANRSVAREFYVGHHSLVVNVYSDHTIPRWIAPWHSERPSVSAHAVFYSTDDGLTWTRLAIGGYLGVMGLDAAQDKVFWGEGMGYASHDLQVHSYGLRKP